MLTLRMRVFALVVAAVIPAMVFEFFNESATARLSPKTYAETRNKTQCWYASELGRLVAGIEHTLLAISKSPPVMRGDMADCDSYVSELKSVFNGPSEIGVADLSGRSSA